MYSFIRLTIFFQIKDVNYSLLQAFRRQSELMLILGGHRLKFNFHDLFSHLMEIKFRGTWVVKYGDVVLFSPERGMALVF